MNCSAVCHKKPQLDLSLQIPASCPWCAWDRADAPLSALIITRQDLLFFNKRDNWLSLSGWLCLVSGNGNGSDQMPRSRSQSSLIREGPANLRTTPLQKQGKGQLTAEWSPLHPSVRAQVKGWWRRSILTSPYGDPYGQSLSMPFLQETWYFFPHPFTLYHQYLPGNVMRQLRGQQTGGLPILLDGVHVNGISPCMVQCAFFFLSNNAAIRQPPPESTYTVKFHSIRHCDVRLTKI